MRLRAGNHRATATAKSLVIAVMAAAMVAQLLSISHEMTVRHFRCAEHGELTHVAALATPAADLPAQTASDALRTGNAQATDTHEHCGVTFTVQGASCTTSIGVAIGAVPPPPALRPAPSSVSWRGRAFVLASAPKTSPPTA